MLTSYKGLRLLLVHAHPDDETINNGATMAMYKSLGAEVTLVTCTRGEEGEVLVEDLAHRAGERPAVGDVHQHPVDGVGQAHAGREQHGEHENRVERQIERGRSPGEDEQSGRQGDPAEDVIGDPTRWPRTCPSSPGPCCGCDPACPRPPRATGSPAGWSSPAGGTPRRPRRRPR